MMRDTLWTASRSAARRERRRRERRRWGQPSQTAGCHPPNPVSPEICSTVGQEDQNPRPPPKIYLKMSKEAKQRGRLKAPRQKPAEAARTLPRRLQGGPRRNRDPAQKQSAPTGTQQTRVPQQPTITTLSRWTGTIITSALHSFKPGMRRWNQTSEISFLPRHLSGWSRSWGGWRASSRRAGRASRSCEVTSATWPTARGAWDQRFPCSDSPTCCCRASECSPAESSSLAPPVGCFTCYTSL